MISTLIRLIKDGISYYNHNKWTREQVLLYSQKKFRYILKYAYKHSPFYKNYYTWKGIKYKDLDDIPINEIPTLTKEQVRNNFYKISTVPMDSYLVKQAIKSSSLLPKVKNNYLVHTSGSTGVPTNFLYDKRALDTLEANFVRLSIEGVNPVSLKDFPIKSLYIAPVGSGYACTALAVYGMERYKCKSIIVNAQDPLSQWKESLKDFNPCYISGYPSCLNIISSLVENKELNLHPKKIITGGEPLTKENCLYYHELFNADVIDYYGCTESICIGASTNYYNGMYLFDDLNYIEKDDENRLIITPLYNKAFPLIRYKLTDMVLNFTKRSSGPLPYTHIDKIMGRHEELMWFVTENGNKDFLHPLFLDDLNVKGILKYQFIQVNENKFILKCVSSSRDADFLSKKIISQINIFLKNKNMKNVKYSIDFVDSIPINPKTGKSKLVIKALSKN